MHRRLSTILLIILILTLFVSFANATTNNETRYFRSDTQTVNTVNAYKLLTTESSSLMTTTITTLVATQSMSIGIKVYQISSSGTKTAISSGEVAVGYAPYLTSSAYLTLTGTWSCPTTSLSSTDAIEIEIWGDTSVIDVLKQTWISEQLGASQLDSNTWTVYYRIHRIYTGRPIYTCEFDFLCGISGSESYITGFKWDSAVSGSWHEVKATYYLHTKQYSNIYSTELLHTKQYSSIYSDFSLHTKQHSEIFYSFLLQTQQYHDITFGISLHTKQYSEIFYNFILNAGAKLWHDISSIVYLQTYFGGALLNENFILAIVLLILCVFLCIKRIPLIGFIVGIMTMFISVTIFINDVDLPANPVFSVMIGLIGILTILLNALKFRES